VYFASALIARYKPLVPPYFAATSGLPNAWRQSGASCKKMFKMHEPSQASDSSLPGRDNPQHTGLRSLPPKAQDPARPNSFRKFRPDTSATGFSRPSVCGLQSRQKHLDLNPFCRVGYTRKTGKYRNGAGKPRELRCAACPR